MTKATLQPLYANRIIQDPAILFGKPVVRGTRVPVAIILEYLADNPDVGELLVDYPRLTMEDVNACLAFALSMVEATPQKTVSFRSDGNGEREASQFESSEW